MLQSIGSLRVGCDLVTEQQQKKFRTMFFPYGKIPKESRDVTLSIKVRLVKALFFPVVMYGCENWTIKKAERQRIDAFKF